MNMFQKLGIKKFPHINFMVILFWELEIPILAKELGIPKNQSYWNLKELETPTLFKIILVVKDSIEAYYFKLVESRIPNCLNGGESKTKIGRIKDSINLIQNGRAKDSICLFGL